MIKRHPLIGWSLLVLAAGWLSGGLFVLPHAQSFSSGSDGSDGALTVAPNQGNITFDPFDAARWGRILDPDGDGVFNFTTITVGSNTTLIMRGDKSPKPVHWLASGNVLISGGLEVSGANGSDTTDPAFRRQVALPGAGGYAGGAGGSGALPATAGDGTGGGSGGIQCPGFLGSINVCGKSGTFTGNRYLIPLVGGSGGEGSYSNNGHFYGGGGGGGAILIASSTSITITGFVNAVGGNGVSGAGGGSGGAIRLVAPTLGGGLIQVFGGSGFKTAPPGWIRLEGFSIGNFNIDASVVTRGSPVDSASLRPASAIRVTAINGIPVPANPTGSFVLPDLTMNSSGPVNVDIEATGIPPGTVVTLQVFAQTPTDLSTLNLPTAQATLLGTLQSSTATASFTFPYGFSRGFVRATWTQ